MSKKKIISAILVIICSFLTACASGEITENVIDNGEAALGDKILVAYYLPNGQVQEMSEMIRDYTGGELCEIRVAESYPDDLDEFQEAVLEDQRTGRRPEITVDKDNLGDYDTLILGFPVWAGEMPMAVPAFLESFDPTGKKVIPFVVEENGDLKKLQDSIVRSAAGAEVEMCTAITKEEEIASWLKHVSVFSELIQIKVGDDILYGGLYQNREAYEFAELLPLTADLYIPAGFARAFNLDTGMENGEYRTRTFEIGKIAYWPEGPAVAVFVDDSEPQTVVPVIHLGKIFHGASDLAESESITIEKMESSE